MNLMTRFRSFRMTLLISLVITASVGVIAYVQIAVKQVEEELPLRVMREKRDMEQVARDFYGFLAVTDAARVRPTAGNLESIRENLRVVTDDLQRLRDRYTFDTLIGASALHAVLSPTIDDVQIWLEEGFGDLPPSSPIVLELVATRARDTLGKVYDKTTEADRIAYEILEQQTGELRRLRNQLIVPFVALGLLAAGMVWLAVRQQRASKRQAEAEAAKESAQTQLQHAIESITEGFAYFDAGDRLVISNTRYRDMFFGDAPDLIRPGTPFKDILRDAVRRGLIFDAKERGDDWVAERLTQHRNPIEPHVYQLGNQRWIQINERKTEDGGTVAIYSDITEIKERELEILKAKDLAVEASDAKSAFLANVSHELRTPLTSILGFTRIIQKRLEDRILPSIETDDAKLNRAIRQVSENIRIILNEGARLTALINNVLDLEKIEAGKMDWDIAPIDATEVIDRAVAATDFLMKEKDIAFSVDIAPNLPRVLGDFGKVVQVIVNLISNAVKFTPEGTVICRAMRNSENAIVISIKDTGCGIAKADQATVFEKFRQVGDTLTDKPTGTGLGLPICREIVDHLGGRIWVESTIDVGSEFFFTLPVSR